MVYNKLLLLSLLALTLTLNPKPCEHLGNDIYYVGVNDHKVDLFEGQYKVPHGVAYNSYVVLDEKITIFDTVSSDFLHEWVSNIKKVLNGKKPTYLIVQHMEPDHAANTDEFMKEFPETTVVASQKAFTMMQNFFGTDYARNRKIVKEGDTLNIGKHTFAFVEAPMVHWPEVIVSYETTSKTLFSADGFGKFGALDVDEPWDDEARRYFIGIVGKYGKQTQALLKKAGSLDIKMICPTHGPVLTENLGHYITLYDKWSSYTSEEEGIVIAYTSVYGHTKKAVEFLEEELKKNGAKKVLVYDLARTDMALVVAEAFKYNKLILATTTYNADVFPWMNDFIYRLVERNFQKKTVGLLENGAWALTANKVMKKLLEHSKELKFLKNEVHVNSALNDKSKNEISEMAKEMVKA